MLQKLYQLTVTTKSLIILPTEAFALTNSKKKICQTIDCRLNAFGHSKYTTNAKLNSANEQFCYFNQKKKDKVYNKFLAKKNSSKDSHVIFQMNSLVDTTKKRINKTFQGSI